MMLIIIILLYYLCRKTVCPCSHFISKKQPKTINMDLKDQFIEMNIKQNVKIKNMANKSFSYLILQVLIDCLFLLSMLKGTKPKGIIYQKVLLKIITSSSAKKTFMINQLILM